MNELAFDVVGVRRLRGLLSQIARFPPASVQTTVSVP
jgi:hypothetical protein